MCGDLLLRSSVLWRFQIFYDFHHYLPYSLISFFFFFLKIRRPPISPLFPYPTLFRSPVSASALAVHTPDSSRVTVAATPTRAKSPWRRLISMKALPVRGDITGSRTSTSSSAGAAAVDRKSTRLNSSHSQISYAVFCLK